jgi:hypothetical protein
MNTAPLGKLRHGFRSVFAEPGARGLHLLRVEPALTLKATECLRFYVCQASLANTAALKVRGYVGPAHRLRFSLSRTDSAKSETSAGRATCCWRPG